MEELLKGFPEKLQENITEELLVVFLEDFQNVLSINYVNCYGRGGDVWPKSTRGKRGF